MADTEPCAPADQLDLNQILLDARQRWLRSSEICGILRNYTKYKLTRYPPTEPPAGSLLLYDRRVIQHFKKDGHNWKTLNDQTAAKEHHSKLKERGVYACHCTYARGKDNENFQRRCYWLIDEQLSNIVLVHYRDVQKTPNIHTGQTSYIPCSEDANIKSQLGGPQTASPCSEQNYSPDPKVQNSCVSDPKAVDWNDQTLFSGIKEVDSGEYPVTSSFVQRNDGHLSFDGSFRADEPTGFLESSKNPSVSGYAGAVFNRSSSLATQVAGHGSNNESNFYFEQQSAADFSSNKLIGANLDADNSVQLNTEDKPSNEDDNEGGSRSRSSEK